MNQSDVFLHPAPYGVAFDIEDLVLLRGWAQQRGLQMAVLLDNVLDGVEFEELVVMGMQGADQRTLTVWRTRDTIYAQTPVSRPHEFSSVPQLLSELRPAPMPRKTLLKRLGLTG